MVLVLVDVRKDLKIIGLLGHEDLDLDLTTCGFKISNNAQISRFLFQFPYINIKLYFALIIEFSILK